MPAMPELRVGSPVRYAGLSVFPLFPAEGSVGTPLTYRLSADALADGSVVVEESSEGGSVPTLIVVNKSDTAVLFLEGEELRGAKQNRILNTSVLIPAGAKAPIPVSCVEQGRWRYTSKQFGSAGMHASAKLRSVLKASVDSSTRSGGGHGSDQGAVWKEVTRQMKSMGSESATMCMSDTYEAHREQVTDYREKIAYAAGAVGLAVAVGPAIVSVDVFDSAITCEKVWPRLLSGVAMDAVEAKTESADAPVLDVMSAFRAGPWDAVPAAAAGEEYRAASKAGKWHGSALVHSGVLVHGSYVSAV